MKKAVATIVYGLLPAATMAFVAIPAAVTRPFHGKVSFVLHSSTPPPYFAKEEEEAPSSSANSDAPSGDIVAAAKESPPSTDVTKPAEETKVEVEAEPAFEFGTAVGGSSAYDRLGCKEEDLAVGVDANEVLQWLGTKEDLVTKFKKDNPKFDETRAQTEVSKFLKDAEMVNSYIAYEKKKQSDPNFFQNQAQRQLQDPSVWATYAAWIVGGAGFALVKNKVIEPKFASGEWEEIHINLPNFFGNNKDALSSSVEKAADTASSTANALSSSLGNAANTASSAADAVSSSVGGAADAATSSVGDAVSSSVGATDAVTSTVTDAISSSVGNVADAVQSAVDAVTSSF